MNRKDMPSLFLAKNTWHIMRREANFPERFNAFHSKEEGR